MGDPSRHAGELASADGLERGAWALEEKRSEPNRHPCEGVAAAALPFVVAACSQRIRRAMYRELGAAGFGLTPEQWLVLTILWKGDGLSQAALCDRTLRDATTISRMVSTMQQDGLVERSIDFDRDARSYEIKLTPQGKSLQRDLIPVAAKVASRLACAISEADLNQAFETLTQILANLR